MLPPASAVSVVVRGGMGEAPSEQSGTGIGSEASRPLQLGQLAGCWPFFRGASVLKLFNDNLGTTQPINNPESTSQRSKHLDIRYFRIRQHVARQDIKVQYIGTDLNVADFFTKALTGDKFFYFRSVVGMRDVCAGG